MADHSLAHGVLNAIAPVKKSLPLLALSLVASMVLERSATACVQAANDLGDPGCSIYEQNCDPRDTALIEETPPVLTVATAAPPSDAPMVPTVATVAPPSASLGGFWMLGGAMVFGIGLFRGRKHHRVVPEGRS